MMYVVEETQTGLWRTTSDDDAGIHVVGNTAVESLMAAQVAKSALDQERLKHKANESKEAE